MQSKSDKQSTIHYFSHFIMSKKSVELNEERVYKQIEEELGKNRTDMARDVKILQEWFQTQPHLPEMPSIQLIQSFLLFNKFSIERTKQKLDMYYTMRSVLPDLFTMHPCSPEMLEQAKVSLVIPLPKLSKDCRRIMYTKISDKFSPDFFNFDRFMCHIFNVFEIMLREDLFLGAHFITDCAGLKMGHLTKVNPMSLKKMSVIMEKVFSNRVASVHLINYHPGLESTLTVVKAILPDKIKSRLIVHKDTEALFQTFPKTILPKDIGGEEEALEDLAEIWIEKMKQNTGLFDKLITMRVDESKRPGKLVNDEDLGFYGNFKKLDVD